MKGPNQLSTDLRTIRMGGPFLTATPGGTVLVPVIVNDARDILSLKLVGLIPPDMVDGYSIEPGPNAEGWTIERNMTRIDRLEVDVWTMQAKEGTQWLLSLPLRISPNMEVGDEITLAITGVANEQHIPIEFEPMTIQIVG